MIISVGINECTTDDECAENEGCIDIVGITTCMCSSGYSGDGANSCTSKRRSEFTIIVI